MKNLFKLQLAVAYQRGINGESFNISKIEEITNAIAALHTEEQLTELLSYENWGLNKFTVIELVGLNSDILK